MRLQHEAIAEARADAFVLTEVNTTFNVGPSGLRSPVIDRGVDSGSWVALVGDRVEPVDDRRVTTPASVVGQIRDGDNHVIVVGSVLPWKAAGSQAPELCQGDESYIEMFSRVLHEHAGFIRDLRHDYPKAVVVWAGDFNQSLSGSNVGASNSARDQLRESLAQLGLVAWNEHLAHADHHLKAIDLICGPVATPIVSVERIDPVRDGIKMSDHAGYIVEISDW